eukprot:3203384-Pleurochrysis_carterae.AAC.2
MLTNKRWAALTSRSTSHRNVQADAHAGQAGDERRTRRRRHNVAACGDLAIPEATHELCVTPIATGPGFTLDGPFLIVPLDNFWSGVLLK